MTVPWAIRLYHFKTSKDLLNVEQTEHTCFVNPVVEHSP